MIAADIEYTEAGTGPVVICLHGIGGGTASFDPQLAGLKNSRVIAWNMPGYGISKPVGSPPSFEDLSDALGRFINVLGQVQVHIIGQSIGGMVALEHVVRRPDQVASLVLIGTTPSFGGRDKTFGEQFLAARLAPLDTGQSMEDMAKEAISGLVGPIANQTSRDQIITPMAKVSEQTWRDILQCLITFNRRDDLAAINTPCCLIAGAHDKNAPARMMEKMAAALPDAEFHLIDGAGHMINQEAPAQTNAIINNFYQRHLT